MPGFLPVPITISHLTDVAQHPALGIVTEISLRVPDHPILLVWRIPAIAYGSNVDSANREGAP
jgi:hypothetical protein